MSNLIAIVGPSGSGKSTSLETLDPKETYIINCQGKPLPFRGSAKSYSIENKNLANIDTWNTIVSLLKGISDNRSDIKNVIIDDAGYIMINEFFQRASEKGFDKFSEFGQHMFNIIDTAKRLRDDLNIIFTFHEDRNVDSSGNVTKSIKLIGKMLSDKYVPEGSFTVLLYTKVTYDKQGKPSYGFVTNHILDYPAKSPKGMFEQLEIPNDLKLVIESVSKYKYE